MEALATNRHPHQRFLMRYPTALLLNPGYWLLHHKWWCACLLTLGISCLLMGRYDVMPIEGIRSLRQGRLNEVAVTIVFQLLTLIVALIGFWYVLVVGVRMHLDRVASEEVKRIATDALRHLHQPNAQIELDTVPTLWPQIADQTLPTFRLCQLVHKEAVDNHYSSRETAIQGFVDEHIGGISEALAIRRIVVQIGILGTFVGLFLALPKLSQIAVSGVSSGVVDELLQSMKLAFTTSIVALACSICLGFATSALGRRVELLRASLEQASLDLVALCRRAVNKSHFSKSLDALERTLATVADRLEEQNRQLDFQSSTIENGLEKLNAVGNDWSKCMTTADGLRLRTEQSLATLSEAIMAAEQMELNSVSKGIERVVKCNSDLSKDAEQAVGSLTRQLRVTIETTERELSLLHQGFLTSQQRTLDVVGSGIATLEKRVADGLRPLALSISTAIEQERISLEAERTRFGQIHATLSDLTSKGMSEMSANIEALKATVDAQLKVLGKLQESLPLSNRALSDLLRDSNKQLIEGIGASLVNRRHHLLAEWMERLKGLALRMRNFPGASPGGKRKK